MPPKALTLLGGMLNGPASIWIRTRTHHALLVAGHALDNGLGLFVPEEDVAAV